jgi:hypothetical protein
MTDHSTECYWYDPLYRTYQVTKAIIFIPPLVICGGVGVSINQVGSVVYAPIDYIINGDLCYTLESRRNRDKCIKEQLFYACAYVTN